MKKLVAVLAGLMTYSAVYALPVYNPAQPDLLKYGIFTGGDSDFGLEFGYRGDFVFDRKLKVKNQVVPAPKALTNYASTINAGQVTLNVWDRLDVYGWVGAKYKEFEGQTNFFSSLPPSVSNVRNIIGTTKEDLAWGVGARAVLWSSGNTTVGVDGQYARGDAKFRTLLLDGQPLQATALTDLAGNPLNPSNFKLNDREWQVSLGIAHRICWMVPYAAVKYSNFRSDLKSPLVLAGPLTLTPSRTFESRNTVGFVCGVSIVDADRMHVTAEGRFIDERALTVAADFRF